MVIIICWQANRGQFEFLRQISQDPSNTVIGLVQDKARTVKKVSEMLGGQANVHILEADLTNYSALQV
jgi:hypothetical protein